MYIMYATGHRPKRLYGYELNDPRWLALYTKFQEILLERHCTEAITGMALGVDTVWALSVLDLRNNKGIPIKLHCAVPCYNLQEPWFNDKDKERFNHILRVADEVTYVTKSNYVDGCLEKRNRYMVDNSDEGVAVWTGSPGGTANCVHYAERCGKPVIQLINDKGELL